MHLQFAGRSQDVSGSRGASADSKRTFLTDRAASHALAAAMTSTPRYFSVGFLSIMTSPLVKRCACPGIRDESQGASLVLLQSVFTPDERGVVFTLLQEL
jgi:hypothetical protein